jgi:hypothetical protein
VDCEVSDHYFAARGAYISHYLFVKATYMDKQLADLLPLAEHWTGSKIMVLIVEVTRDAEYVEDSKFGHPMGYLQERASNPVWDNLDLLHPSFPEVVHVPTEAEKAGLAAYQFNLIVGYAEALLKGENPRLSVVDQLRLRSLVVKLKEQQVGEAQAAKQA